MSFKTVLVKNSSPLCRKNAKNRAVFPNSTLSPSPKFAARPSDLPPPPLSFPDQIQYGVSLSLSLSLRKQRRTGPFFSSQVSEINFLFLGWTENGKARRGKINPTSLSLSLHIRREEKMPPSSIPPPLGKSTRTLQCFCVVQQRVWEPFNYFPLFPSPTGRTT